MKTRRQRQPTRRQRQRQQPHTTRRLKLSKEDLQRIQHHHLLLRMEMRTCPEKSDKKSAELLIHRIIKDIHMKLLAKPKVYYVVHPRYNEGLTAIAPIQTSHIAFHFWKNPDPAILKSPGSRCLLEFDIYTCGALTSENIQRVLHHLTPYGPTRADVTVLNRKWSLAIDKHLHWSAEDGEQWVNWIDSIN